MRAVAEVAILDVVLVHLGAIDRVLDGVGCHRHRRGDVESAATGFRQPRTGIRNNDGFTHFFALPLNWRLCLAAGCQSYIIPAGAMKIPRPELPPAGISIGGGGRVRKSPGSHDP